MFLNWDEKMLRRKLQFIGIALALSLSASAQESGFRDELLDRFAGYWVLSGEIAGDEVIHHVDARWVLGHQYFRFNGWQWSV